LKSFLKSLLKKVIPLVGSRMLYWVKLTIGVFTLGCEPTVNVIDKLGLDP
jgi:hypothetical protein